jgi:hypothetical protein
MDLESTKLCKKYATLKTKRNKYDNYIYYRTGQIVTDTMFYRKLDVHKFIGEHTAC